MRRIFILSLLFLILFSVSAETSLGTGVSGHLFLSESPALYPEIWVSSRSDKLFPITDNLSSLIQLTGTISYLGNLGWLSWELGFSGDLSFERNLTLFQPVLSLNLLGNSETTTPEVYLGLDFQYLWGDLDYSYSIKPYLFLEMQQNKAFSIGGFFLASRLFPQNINLSASLQGEYTLPWDYTGYFFTPQLSLSWYSPDFQILSAEIWLTRSFYTQEEEVVENISLPSRSFTEGKIELSLTVPLGRALRLVTSLPVSGSIKDHPSITDFQLQEDREWTLALQPKAILGIPLGSAGYFSFSLTWASIFSNSDYQRSNSLSSEISFDYSF